MFKKCSCCKSTNDYAYAIVDGEYYCSPCDAELRDSKNFYKGFDAADEEIASGADVQMLIGSFEQDPPDSGFQWGYLSRLKLKA